MQRPWYWGRRHGEDVDSFLQLLEFFLLSDAEALLLVNDDQPQVLELQVLREHSVGPYDDVDLTRAQLCHESLLLLWRVVAAEERD